MFIDKKTTQKIAHLSRIKLDDTEQDKIAQELSNILTSICSLLLTIFEGWGGFFNQVNSLIEINPSYVSFIINPTLLSVTD